jgi:hypothetical protein
MKRVLEFDISAQVKRGNPKFQIPNSKQIPSTKLQQEQRAPIIGDWIYMPRVWNLELGACLGFGIWDLGFLPPRLRLICPTSPATVRQHD